MAIQLAQADSQPAVTYDHVHLLKLDVEQPVFTDDSSSPIYRVFIGYQLYGVADGVRYYHPAGLQEIHISDFLGIALADAANSDTSLITAISALESAVAAIIGDQTGIAANVI